MTSRFSLSNVSGYLRTSMYKFLDQKQPKIWYKNLGTAKSIIYSFGKTGMMNETFTTNIQKLCEMYEGGEINDKKTATRIMMCMLNLRLITAKEMKKKYPMLYVDAISPLGETTKHMVDLIRNEIWDVNYWKRALSSIKPSHFLTPINRAMMPSVIYFLQLLQEDMSPECRGPIMAEVNRIF